MGSEPAGEAGAVKSRPVARVGLALAPLLFGVVWLAPLPLETPAHRLAAVFAAVVVLWVTEALPIAVTALLIAPALVATGVTDAKSAFAPYADPLLFLFVGGFFIARAMSRHGLDRRLATASRAVAGRAERVRLAFMVAGAALSMWISNTATTAILLPILLGTFDEGEEATGSVLAVAYACSIGGLGSLVGSPPNLITARFLQESGVAFGFVDWMAIGLPSAIVLLVLAHLFLRRLAPPRARAATREPAASESSAASTQPMPVPLTRRAARPLLPLAALFALGPALAEVIELDLPTWAPEVGLGFAGALFVIWAALFVAAPGSRWSRGERVAALAFAMAVSGWMVPGLLKASGLEEGRALAAALPGGGVALIAASVLFVLRDRRGERVLPWEDAAKIDWGIIMLFGGGISLGKQMVETGFAEAVSRGFVAATGLESLWALTALVTVFTIFFTEVCSNTASANMLVPIVIAVAQEMGVSPLPPALAVGLAASCAFMLPIATGPNAIAYGTGRVPLPAMMRTGAGLNLICAGAIVGLVWLLT